MNLIDLLTSPASAQHDTMLKVIDRANKMQAATVRKAEKIEKAQKRRRS